MLLACRYPDQTGCDNRLKLNILNWGRPLIVSKELVEFFGDRVQDRVPETLVAVLGERGVEENIKVVLEVAPAGPSGIFAVPDEVADGVIDQMAR